ncbi:MAG: hypothetical protein IT359_17175 [Gemmatimonadaceae bacterium]|nr:hypothetical protein [Gemmatimonadaceae bacterium]
MRPPAFIFRLLAAASLATPLALAGAQGGPTRASNIFAVPDIPAGAFLDNTTLPISRPGTMQDLASALISGIDGMGRVRQGVALEIAPFLFVSPHLSLSSYRTTPGFLKANLRFSLATQRTAGDTAATDLSVGMRATLFDDRDYLRTADFSAQAGRALLQCAASFAPTTPGEQADTAGMNGCIRDFVESYPAPRWNSSAFIIAAAYGVRFDESVISRSRGTGGRAWFSYAHGVQGWGQLLAHGAGDYVRGRTKDSTYSAATIGAKMLVGSQRFNGFYQNAWQWRSTRATSPIDNAAGTWSAGVEFAAREGLWISTGFGSAYADAAAPDRVVVFANVRWGVSSSARLSPIVQ